MPKSNNLLKRSVTPSLLFLKMVSFIVFCCVICLFTCCFVACQKEYQRTYKHAATLVVKEDIPSLNAAIKEYDKAIRYTLLSLNGKEKALRALGVKLLEHQMYHEAIKAFEAAILLLPSSSILHYYLGLSYANAAKLDAKQNKQTQLIKQAEASYRMALEIDETHTIVHYALGVFLGFIKKDLRAGIQSLEVAKQQEPNHLETLFALGNLYYQAGQYVRSKQAYETIVEQTPPKSPKHKKAIENMKRIHSVSP